MKYGLIIVATLFLLIGGAGLYLFSDSGRAWMAEKLSELASSDDQIITISSLQGSLWSDITLEHVTIADKEGVWLTVNNAHAAYSISDFWHNRPPVTQVDVQHIVVARLPESPPTESQPTEIPSLREMALYLPQSIAIQDITIDQNVAGAAQRLTVNGNGGAEAYNLHIATLEGVQTALDAIVVPNEHDFMLKLTLDEMPGGIIGGLLTLPPATALHAKADITADINGMMQIHTLSATAGTMALNASGTYDVAQGTVNGTAQWQAPDMDIVQALAKQPLQGDVKLDADVAGTLEALQFEVTAKSTAFTFDTQHMDNTTLHAKGQFDAVAMAGNAMIEGSTTHNGKPFTLATPVALTKTTLHLPELNLQYDTIAAKAQIAAEGTLEAFDLTSNTTLTTPYGESQIGVNGKVNSTEQRYQGEVNGSFAYRKEQFALNAAVDATADHASINTLSLQGPGVDVKGEMEVDIPAQLADGVVHINAKDLAPLGRLVQQPLRGLAQAEIKLTSRQDKQHIDIQAVAKKLRAFDIAADQADIQAKAEDIKAFDTVTATITGQGITLNTLRIDRINATAKGSLRQAIALAIDGKGMYQDTHPWNLTLAAEAAQPKAAQYRVKLNTMTAHYANLPILLHAPSTLSISSTETAITPLLIDVAGGSVQAEGRITPKQAQGALHIKNIALAQLPLTSLPEGTANATLTLAGTEKAPSITWDAKGDVKTSGQDVALSAEGSWKQGILRTTANATAATAKANADITLKAPLSLAPLAIGITAATPLSGTINTHVPLDMLNGYLRPSGNQLAGLLSGDAVLSGKIGRPAIEGEFTLKEGRYDQSDTGICLRDMQATLRGTKERIELTQFQAVDNEKKLLTAQGAIILTGNTPQFSGQGHFDHFRLFCGGLASGEIEGGVSLKGTTHAMNIAGKLTLGPLNVQIPGAQSESTIPTVETEWIRANAKRTDEQNAAKSVIGLDVSIHAPNQIFVRGRGLDAEFEGDMRITGTANSPLLNGQFSSRRGSFTLLDRALRLDRAVLKFQGAVPPSPYVDVKAVSKVQSTTVTVAISGRALKPSFNLRSSPSLPQDEVLALLLFGRQLATISPFEALKLAQATRVLAGQDSGGPGVLGTVRDTLGLDELDIGMGESNSVTVSTGKYVTDKVYVGVTQGSTPDEREIVTEIDISPSVSGKTTMDGKGNQGVGVQWKKDY